MSKYFFSSNDGVINNCTSAFEIDLVAYLQGLKEIADYLEMGNASRSITDGSCQDSTEELDDPPTSPTRY